MLKYNLRSVLMKKIVMASAVMAATAMAGEIGARPEASVPTPAEHHEILDKVPNLSEKENVDWQKMREERRAAREQILQNLRNNSAAEKKEMREVSVKAPVLETPVSPIEKNVDMPKNELVREKKMEEFEPFKGPFGNVQPVTPMGFPGNKKIKDPIRPFNPHERRNNPKVVEPIKPFGWDKGNFPRK